MATPLRPRALIARKLRRDATDVERRLWRALRENDLPWKLRRQHPIGRRIVEFACPERKLAIELDGGQHDAQAVADDERSAELARHGYRVIRFWNSEVLENLEGVIERIRSELEKRPRTSPFSTPWGGDG
jgi:very-short-patch-repair endonuclease